MRDYLWAILRGAAPRRRDGPIHARLENASDATLKDIGLTRDQIGGMRLRVDRP